MQIILGGAPEGFDARLVARELAARRAGHPCRARRQADGGDAGRAGVLGARGGGAGASRPGIACPTIGSRPTPRSPPRRMATLAALAHGLPGPFVLLTHAERGDPAGAGARGGAGGVVPRHGRRPGGRGATARLSGADGLFAGRHRRPNRATMRVRGGIVDIYPPGPGGPVRLDFFGDVLDGARRFDAETQRTTEKLKRGGLCRRCPRSSWTRRRSRGSGRTTGSNSARRGRTTRSTRRSARAASIRGWSIGCRSSMTGLRRCSTICRDASVMLDDQVTPARLARWEGIDDQYDARREAMGAKGRIDTVYKPVRAGAALSRRRGLGSGAWQRIG